jgi:hypothetical protein
MEISPLQTEVFMFKRLSIPAALIVVLGVGPPATATPIMRWEFVEPSAIVSPVDTIEVLARIYNDSTEGEVILAVGPAELAPLLHYNFEYNLDAASGLPSIIGLAPGSSVEFSWGWFVPISPPVPDGTYMVFPAQLEVLLGDGFVSGDPSNTFTRTVSHQAARVPEPSSLLLVGTGLAGLVFGRRIRRQRTV